MEITIIRADITTLDVDAVVNAANSTLLGGGGVDGAIHRAAGPELLAECRELRRTRYPDGLAVGDAVATGAGMLKATWVIHTVGPNRQAGQTDRTLLRQCFARSLDLAGQLGARSVAFPAIGGGVYGWSAADVAQAAGDAFAAAMATTENALPHSVVVAVSSADMAAAFRAALG